MARNLVQIADDVKDMSVAQIRRHIQEGSHIPIWILTGELDKKLKNLATAGAQQAAAQNASQPSTVVDGLMDAVGNIPEAAPDTTVDMTAPNPLSNAGATAAAAPPQPNPAIQALMAAQNPTARMAGGGMPTVRAVRGYHPPVMYPGKSIGSLTTNRDTPKLTPEMWAMITAARQKRGDPRLYGQGKARFEEAYVKGAKPTSEPAFGGILSQLAAVERDRAYGGSDTLPYSMTGSRGGPVGNLPTVRMQGVAPNELAAITGWEGVDWGQSRIEDILPSVATRGQYFTEEDFTELMRRNPFPASAADLPPGERPLVGIEGVEPRYPGAGRGDIKGGYESFISSPYFQQSGLTAGEAVPTFSGDFSPSERVSVATAGGGKSQLRAQEISEAKLQEYFDKYGVLPEDWKEGMVSHAGGVDDPTEYYETVTGTGEKSYDQPIREVPATPARLTSKEERAAPEARDDPSALIQSYDQEALELAIRQATQQEPPKVTLLDLGDADISKLNVTKKQDLDGDVSLPAVSTLSEMVAERKALAGDFTERERVINEKAAADLKTFEDQKVVPQSVKDIRGHIAKSIEALERNPLPWMRAAAAAINGRQPMLIAMTNAMIGYTEGKEELRKEGLETMGKLVDLDMQVAGLEAQRAADIFAQKQLITQAQRAEVQGDRDRAAQYITSASASRDAALGRNIDIERIEAQKYVAHMNLFGTERAAAQDVLKALFTEHGNDPKWFTVATDGTATPTAHAYTTAYETVDPKAPSYAGQTAFFAAQKYKKDVLNTINDVKTDAMKLADEKFDRELLAGDSPFKQWMAANGLSLPEGATVDDPTSMVMYQMWAITQDERYINDPEIQAALHQRFPELRRIQSGGSGNDDPLNWKK